MIPTKPQTYTAVVHKKEQLTAKVYVFTLKVKDPQTMDFSAGQFINVEVGGGVHRQYSIASSPHHRESIELLVDVAPGGPGSQYFEKLGEGAHVKFAGPMGRFAIASYEGTIIFLSAGTGLAPFKSMIDFLCEEQARAKDYEKRHMYLYQTFRHKEDIFWDEYFDHLEEEHPNFHYLVTLTRPDASWLGCQGYVQTCMDRQLLRAQSSHFYICGGAKMVEGVLAFLRENMVAEDRIHFEPF